MGKIEFDGFAETLLSFEEIAELPTSVLDQMLDAEAQIVMRQQASVARSYGLVDTGQMVNSITCTSPKDTADGGRTCNVYPQGSRTRGKTTTRNASIAFYNEYGVKGRPGKPWMETANAQCEDEARAAAEEVFNSYIGSK